MKVDPKQKPATAPPAPPEPPEYLSESSKELWRDVIASKNAETPQRRALLAVALTAKDRAEEARQLIARDGLISQTKKSGVMHTHPAQKIERESQTVFVRTMVALGLRWNN